MSDTDDTTSKVHYICQTYVETTTGRTGQSSLKIGKQFQYTTAEQATGRAERECRSDDCAGADAYMVIEDPQSGEVSEPTFLIRVGKVPELDDF
ncbi:hypothetical protein SAMN04488523_1272 [Sulfitobacter brevis]|uniref:Uncharacterized protein n=1 Tax=Sulfitobacter brevis TaxID=74348 RepID=A0A1I2GKX1_9RHOB|nr:hypothetical protein [Sulfitobacter brevis]SFF18574.1 hypothetical protein SAMN04488523_1272 [Sulfitobacter brevis]